jgi:hypothetical protein
MIAFLVLAVIIGACLILIEEGLRRAPEGIEDEHGLPNRGKCQKDQISLNTREKAPTLPSILHSVRRGSLK